MKLVLAALLGATATFLLTAIKSSRDEQRDLCDTLGTSLLKAADLAAEYWLTDGKASNIALLEAKLMGAQAYLSRYKLLANGWFLPKDRWAVEDLLADFYDAITGGQFQVKSRSIDAARAQACQVRAAELAVLVRLANMNSITIGAMVLRLVRWYPITRSVGRLFQWQEPRL